MTSRFQWAAVAAGLALTLGGCQTLTQPTRPTDPAFVAALSKTKNDGAPLFAGLLASTNCNAAANAAAFGAVESDITDLRYVTSVMRLITELRECGRLPNRDETAAIQAAFHLLDRAESSFKLPVRAS